ncbi:zinc ribbon domain-containing protein [Kordiimonas sp. SCSIO 12610]|nr:zinc ribbon domain-containing protein [Kordiimonas sp. SCSIO 12610]
MIDQAIWDKVQERKDKYTNQRPEQSNRSRTLIQGLVICDECGGKYTQKNKDYIYCMNAKEAGTCSNKKGIKRRDIEDKLLSSLSSILNDQHFIEIFATEFETALKDLTSGELESVKVAENKLKDLDRQIENIIDAIAEGISTPAMKQKLLALSSERETHESSIINSIPTIKIPNQTDIQNRYNDILLNLDSERLQTMDEISRKKMIEQIRGMTSKISIHPNKDQNKPKITFEGDIKTLLSLTFQGADQKLQQAMVAEEGFEPPTHGL